MPSLPRRALTLALVTVLAGLAVGAGAAGAVTESPTAGTAAAPEDPSPAPGPARPSTSQRGSDTTQGATAPTRPFADALTDGLPGERPNIVVIMADDMRQDELTWMPNVRRLIGDRGVEFANSFSPYPLCCPARASFLTGQYTHNHGVWSNRPPYGFSALDDSDTVATRLSAAGYQTAFLGKYLNGYGTAPARDGSGESFRYVPPGWSDWRASINRSYAEGTTEAGGTYNYFSTTLNDNGTLRGNPRVHQTRLLGDETEDMVAQLARSPRPFFMWASYVAPHVGGPVERDDPRPISRADGSAVKVTTPARPVDVRGMFDHTITKPLGAVPEPDMRDKPSFLREYPTLNAEEIDSLTTLTRQRAESLYVLDQEVGRTVDALEQSGELDNTVVVFTSDNGYILGEHGILKNKRLPYESSIRVPTLMAGPGIPAGEVRRDPFLTIDFAPTFLDIAAVRPRRATDGVSMLGVARSGDRGWRRAVLTEAGPQPIPEDGPPVLTLPGGPSPLRFTQGVRTPRYLYVEHATSERELYDLELDPLQLESIADEPRARPLVRMLAVTLERLRTCRGERCAVTLPRGLQTP